MRGLSKNCQIIVDGSCPSSQNDFLQTIFWYFRDLKMRNRISNTKNSNLRLRCFFGPTGDGLSVLRDVRPRTKTRWSFIYIFVFFLSLVAVSPEEAPKSHQCPIKSIYLVIDFGILPPLLVKRVPAWGKNGIRQSLPKKATILKQNPFSIPRRFPKMNKRSEGRMSYFSGKACKPISA